MLDQVGSIAYAGAKVLALARADSLSLKGPLKKVSNRTEIVNASVSHVFRSVGHGLFAQGHVRTHGSPEIFLRWVHDCGSTSYGPREREIARARRLLGSPRRIDVLIVSHFDADHVNGLRELLRGVCVRTVVLPYAAPADRLLFALRGQGPDSLEHIEFLASPTAYIQSAAETVGEFIYIDAAPGDDLGEGSPLEHEPNSAGSEPRPETPEWRVWGNDKSSRTSPINTLNERHFCGEAGIEFLGIWEFRFFNRRRWRGCAKDLREQVEAELKTFEAQPPAAKDYRVLIERLRAMYHARYQFGGTSVARNEISLITYAGPVGTPKMIRGKAGLFPALSHPRISGRQANQKPHAVLYTGDITMRERLRADLMNLLTAQRWLRIGALQVPHHGADTAWKDPASSKWKHRWSVFSSGATSRHPGKLTKAALASHDPTYVNENTAFASWYVAQWHTRAASPAVQDC